MNPLPNKFVQESHMTEASTNNESHAAGPGVPLSGVRVLDLTTFLSGPFGTQIMADLDADVIKVEPFQGDSSRSVPPHFVGDASAYYLGANRGKRSIAVDLKRPSGVAAVLRIMETVDVVIENYRPGVASRLGLDATQARARRPDLIWASISGFGQTGKQSRLPAYDMIVQALSGVMSLTGEPGRPSVRLGIPAGDTVAGMYAVIGILAALEKRHRTGEGATLDVSMLDCQLAMTSYQAVYATVGGVTPQPQGARHDSIPTYRSFVGGDGREFVVTANSERMWADFCGVLGLSHLADDPRFRDGGARLQNRESLWAILEEAVKAKGAAVWVDEMQQVGVPCALIHTVPEALADARRAGRGMVLEMTDERNNSVEVVGNPIKFTDQNTREADAIYPPRLGQDSLGILQEIGFSEEEINDVVADGGVMGETLRDREAARETSTPSATAVAI
jgi:CoA:oxalate CoA-transferase